MDGSAIEISTHASLSGIDPAEWDACACPEADSGRATDPFTTYRFLSALEESGSVGAGTGWTPHYLTAQQDGKLIGVAPLYGKSHSQGEYMFDHNFAQAFERSGGQYYPKLQIAAPFTPVTGRRFLTRPGHEVQGMGALIQGAVQITADNNLSSLHATFCTEAEALAGAEMGLLHRTSQQYHWTNEGYKDWDGFLAELSSRKRKTLRKERATAQAIDANIVQMSGSDIKPHHLDAMWTFYQDTGARKWGQPYLTRAFFDIAAEYLKDDILLVFAERDGEPIAGALNFIGRDTLFGRYWGCTEHHACLHFEICYYQAIDYALAHGLKRVEAGAQGEHKLARGYLPVTTHSLHWFADAGFRDAVAKYLTAERAAVSDEIEVLTNYGPFRRADIEEQE
ncbi:GNAT family N-acetyltransferase [Octadecabacter sp. 1_MG-2023]|uniref:GNAT family N-acetyltransferase n=1 Tax=unclassified Octadecabacter TaxID=196158 RepID=UPI001C09906C|nr:MULTISPECIES: GNAT family N-acetyltransferase [unclassified Octadecabacter]MBU2992541.1 GNAT family N-acetyltransferase [Octadecabacter sp. B2R22]MDO6734702.1 GNAT family N-acetyltransferase [Octadecabacter sp. 1_MG-2023]